MIIEPLRTDAMTAVQRQVALGCRVMKRTGLDNMVWGHLAARDPADRGVWMKASGSGPEEVAPEDVILVGWDGTVLEGEGSAPIEYPIHTEIMLARPDVGATLHSHASHAVAFMATGRRLRPISHDGAWLVPPDLPRFTETADLVRTSELGRRLAESLGTRRVVLIPHHGIVAADIDVPYAVMTSVLLERSCQLQLLAQGGGGVETWSSDDEAIAKRDSCWADRQIRNGWEYLVRLGAAEQESW